MRLRLLALLLATSASLLAGGQRIVHVWTDYHDAASFDRIGEYFGGEEHHTGRIVLRTQPAAREGFYFLVRLADPKAVPAGSRWLVDVLAPGEKTARSLAFALPEGQKEPVALLGLTGRDWPGPKTHPLAWRVRLVDPSGRDLVAQASFLWQ